MDERIIKMLVELDNCSREDIGIGIDLVAYWVHQNFFENETPKNVDGGLANPRSMPQTFELIEQAIEDGHIKKIEEKRPSRYTGFPIDRLAVTPKGRELIAAS